MKELNAVSRATAPRRTLVLISCSAGSVNGKSASPAEIVLSNRLALNVIAPQEPVSAQVVPGMLQDFLIGKKTIDEAFQSLGVVTENRRPEREPEARTEVARLNPGW